MITYTTFKRRPATGWIGTIHGVKDEIRKIDTDDVTADEVKSCATEIRRGLERLRPLPEHEDRVEFEVCLAFEEAEETGEADVLNDALTDLYDYGDAYRVIID